MFLDSSDPTQPPPTLTMKDRHQCFCDAFFGSNPHGIFQGRNKTSGDTTYLCASWPPICNTDIKKGLEQKSNKAQQQPVLDKREDKPFTDNQMYIQIPFPQLNQQSKYVQINQLIKDPNSDIKDSVYMPTPNRPYLEQYDKKSLEALASTNQVSSSDIKMLSNKTNIPKNDLRVYYKNIKGKPKVPRNYTCENQQPTPYYVNQFNTM